MRVGGENGRSRSCSTYPCVEKKPGRITIRCSAINRLNSVFLFTRALMSALSGREDRCNRARSQPADYRRSSRGRKTSSRRQRRRYREPTRLRRREDRGPANSRSLQPTKRCSEASPPKIQTERSTSSGLPEGRGG